MFPEVVTGLFNVGSNLLTNLFNFKANEEANELTRENNQFQKDVFNQQMAWTKYQQEQTWNREDTAWQRTKDDLVKAGYSPLAANGTNQSGALASQPSAPELQSINPFQMQNMGIDQLADIIGQAQDRNLKSRELDIQEQHYLTTEKQKKVELNIKRNEVESQIKQNQQLIDNNYNVALQNLDLNKEKLGFERYKETKNFIVKMKELNDLSQFRNDKEAHDKMYQIMKDSTDGKGHFKTDFDSYFNYLQYKNWFEKKQSEYMDKIAKASKEVSSYSRSSEYNEFSQPTFFDNDGREKSESYKTDPVNAAYHEWYSFLAQNGFPVWIEDTNQRKFYR